MIAFSRHRSPKLKVVAYCHHRFRWTISGHYVNGKRVRRFFVTKGEAETFLNQLRVKRENLGNRAAAIDQKLHVMAVEAADRLKPYGQTIAGAIEFYIRHTEAAQRSCTVEQVTEMLVAAKKAEGKNAGYVTAMRSIFKRFCASFEGRLVAEITAAEIDDWLRAIPLEPLTRNNHRRVVSMLFSYAVLRRYCSDNPVARIPKAKVKAKPIGVLTPEETQSLLESAPDSLRPALAIAAFAGLRQAEILKLDWSEVRLDRGFIEVTAAKSKTASRRLVMIQPNLKAWLERAPKQSGPVYPVNGRKLTDAARRLAGLKDWPSNALRHNYGSYHLSMFQDASALALQMGHTTTSILFQHYREVIDPIDAQRYWQIAPRSKPVPHFPLAARPRNLRSRRVKSTPARISHSQITRIFQP